MGNEAAGAFHTRGFPMWTGVHTAAVSYTTYAARVNPSSESLGTFPRWWRRRRRRWRWWRRRQETDPLRRRGNGEQEGETELSLYISTDMPTETSPHFSIQSLVLFFLSTLYLHGTCPTRRLAPPPPSPTPAITVPRDMDLIVRQVMHRVTRVANDSVGYVFFLR